MEYDSLPPAPELPSWDRLMRAFLTLLQTDGPRTRGDSVCELFFDDPWFQDLVARRAKHAVDVHTAPSDCRDDLEQEISLLFLQKARKTPDMHVNLEVVESHFGGWIWTIVDRLCIEAIQRLHRIYLFDGELLDDVPGSTKESRDIKIDVGLLVGELPMLTQTILAFFNDGYTLKEIADLVDEKYWRVCELYRGAIVFLRERLGD
jgi:DNA-directed RNA polymerase specialized sigma24 family protein